MTKSLALVLVVLLMAFSAFCGWTVGKLSNYRSGVKLTQRAERLQAIVEGYKPTCTQLKSEGVHGPITIKDNIFLVEVEKNYFHVYGINAEPGLPPVSWWWGAGREAAIEQTCK